MGYLGLYKGKVVQGGVYASFVRNRDDSIADISFG